MNKLNRVKQMKYYQKNLSNYRTVQKDTGNILTKKHD